MSHLSFKSFLKREKFTIIFGVFIFFYILGVYLIFEFERAKNFYFLYTWFFFTLQETEITEKKLLF